MKDKLIQHFAKYSILTEEEIGDLEESMELKHYKKKDLILKQGQYYNDSYYIVSGIIRETIDNMHYEKTINIYSADEWLINTSEEDQAAKFNWVCETDTIVITGNERKAKLLYEKHPKFKELAMKIIENELQKKANYINEFMLKTPELKYLDIIVNKPEWLLQISQYNIASYIGITPETLSRIKKKLSGA